MNSHICHVINNLVTGGAEQYVVQLSNYLNSSGHRVSVIGGEPQLLRDWLNPGGHVETLELHPGATRSPIVYVRMLSQAIQRLTTYFRREGVTVVHTHLVASALPAWIAARLCGIPVIHSKMHAVAVGSGYERALFASRLPLLLVDRFLAFSRYSEVEMREQWHVPSGRILVSSIGVDTTRFFPDPEATAASRRDLGLSADDRVMLVVARLRPEKDVELAIRAARFLDEPKAVLLIAGDGPQLEFLEQLARDLPGRTRIRFLGLLQDPRPAYAAVDVLLQTTRGPDLGTVVLEAMASGTPVVIAYRDEEEHKMAVNTFDGLDIGAIVKATPEAMAAGLRGLLADSARLLALRNEVRAFVEHRHARQLIYPAMVDSYTALEVERVNGRTCHFRF